MKRIEKFEELTIWQDARELTNLIYQITKDETLKMDYKLVGQLRNAAISIMNNIAEGFECKSDKKFSNYLDIAKGSCGEVRSMLYVLIDAGYINNAQFEDLHERCIKLSKGIFALKKYLDS